MPIKNKSMNKYKNRKTTVDHITFDSKAEARRYGELKLLERAGLIKALELQPEFLLVPGGNGERAVKYRGDFKYVDGDTDKTVVEDVKGHRTKDYIIKRKLLKHLRPDIEFREIEAENV